jgi:2-methylisocitrate lyase-like PEP mutase family enzyme
MNASALAAQAEQLRGLHVPGSPLLLVNAWDPPSARRLARDGYPAIATTSAGVAEALGHEDGNVTPAGEMLAAVSRIAAVVDVPVTADLEAGYGLEPPDLVDGLLRAGAVGLNFEDTDHERGALVDAGHQAARLVSIKDAGREAGVDVVLNARVDVFLHDGEPAAQLDEAVRRGRLYAQAGADCVYPIGVRGRDAIRCLVEEVGAPLNVLAVPGGLTFEQLAELGVARASFGSGLMHTAMDAAAQQAADYGAG